MTVFKIMFSVYNIILKIEDGDLACGFVKNEYVLAKNKTEAVKKASKNVRKRISLHPKINIDPGSALELRIDDIVAGVSPWKLRNKESFLFFPMSTRED
ncbi:MAG: hypothetical protein HY080_04560 [Gammaproteobacteria bacterium]|nr:hypothetical protein [Gammaproteobacteria bacterium]